MYEKELKPDKKFLNFSSALVLVKGGLKIRRDGWHGKELFVALQTPDGESKMTLAYLCIEYANGNRCPWIASHVDILSEDWYAV